MLSPIQGSFGGDAIRVQWERCASATAGCSDIPNTLSAFSPAQIFQNALASYTLQAGDAGYWIRARVTAFRTGSICPVCGNVTVWAVPVGEIAKGVADQLSDLGVAVSNVGPGKSLADKVKDAQTALGTNDVPGTCSILGAFINEVKAQSGEEDPARHGCHLDLRRRPDQDGPRLLERVRVKRIPIGAAPLTPAALLEPSRLVSRVQPRTRKPRSMLPSSNTERSPLNSQVGAVAVLASAGDERIVRDSARGDRTWETGQTSSTGRSTSGSSNAH